jgi:hypothetical protein
MPALGQAGDWLTRLPVCDRVPALAELVNDALGTHWQMDVRVGQELSRSSNLRHQTPGTVLAAETEVIASLLADRMTNQRKRRVGRQRGQ